MVCAWKYGRSIRATVIKAKASFSIGGILFFRSPKCSVGVIDK